MGEIARWVFGEELPATLFTDMGWFFTSSGSSSLADTVTTPVRTWTGAPTRYALRFKGGACSVTLPAWMTSPTSNGRRGVLCATITVDHSTVFDSTGSLLYVAVTFTNPIYLNANSGSGALSFYVFSLFQQTTGVYDWSDYHQVAIAYDTSANPHKGRVEIDGVVAIAEQTQAAAASGGTGATYWFFNHHSAGQYVNELRSFDSYSDSPPVMFVSRGAPTADGTDTGTWTPDSGSNDWSRLAHPYDASTYTENAASSPGDYVEVTTPTLATMANISTAAVIDGVSLLMLASGATASMDARLSDDGATFDNGADLVLGGTTGSAHVNSAVRPSDAAAWSASDSPTLRAHVTA